MDANRRYQRGGSPWSGCVRSWLTPRLCPKSPSACFQPPPPPPPPSSLFHFCPSSPHMSPSSPFQLDRSSSGSTCRPSWPTPFPTSSPRCGSIPLTWAARRRPSPTSASCLWLRLWGGPLPLLLPTPPPRQLRQPLTRPSLRLPRRCLAIPCRPRHFPRLCHQRRRERPPHRLPAPLPWPHPFALCATSPTQMTAPSPLVSRPLPAGAARPRMGRLLARAHPPWPRPPFDGWPPNSPPRPPLASPG